MYALTASPFRADKMDDLIWAFCGPVVYRYPPSQGIRDGYITPMDYHQVVVPIRGANIRPNMNHVKEYIELHSHPDYVRAVADMCRKSLTKGKKTLVLYKSIECCKALANELGVEAAHGEWRKPFYDFRKGETDICIANINLLGEGIDVPSISTLIYCAGTASPVSAIQAFGRALRKSDGKTKAVVVDVIPDLHKWKEFGRIRKAIAEEYKA
jgi:superfamily II DNA or RNA helicase